MSNTKLKTLNAKSRLRANDWRLFLRLLPYARRSQRLLLFSMLLLVPVAVANALPPLLIGQAISLVRNEPGTYEFLRHLSLLQGLHLLEGLLLITVIIQLVVTGFQGFWCRKSGNSLPQQFVRICLIMSHL